ncbi:MAG TPA: GNAT family N-acetyltransferase [Candidatus Sulfotelmatobacter sp.]|nr:GNAT family N-acetyltransferase [Candidatus Sulfotelmatobacter sp.]
MRVLETDRLRLRPFEQLDLNHVAKWHNDLAAAREFLDYCAREYRQRGIGPWAMVLKLSDQIAGHCGFPHVDFKHHIGEVNYYVALHHRGNHLATEALRAILRFGFAELGFHRIQGRCETDNVASERVLQKSRMRFEKIVPSSGNGGSLSSKLYCIDDGGHTSLSS